MGMFEVTAPNGQKFEITAPDGATEQQVMEYAKKQFGEMQSPTLDERAQEVLGLDPNIKRSNILPFARNEQGGIIPALPQFAADMAKSVLLPGHAIKGGRYDETDVTKMALDFNPMTPRGRISRGQARRAAPDAEDLKRQSTALYEQARAGGVRLSGDSYTDMASRIESKLRSNGYSESLDSHNPVKAALSEIYKRVGDDVDLEELEVLRKVSKSALKHPDDHTRMLGAIIRDEIDGLVDNMGPQNVTGGNPEGVAKALKGARSLYQRKAKVEMVDDIIENAKLQASGFENGLRIGFRRVLQSKEKRRGFTPDEIDAMKKVVDGGPARQALRILGKMGFGSQGSNSFLGGSISSGVGAGAGGAIAGGPGAMLGAVAGPAVGRASQESATMLTKKAADTAQRLMAGGGKDTANTSLGRLLLRQAPGPIFGTQIGPNGGQMINGVEYF